MIELSLLGLHALRGSDGHDLTALPAQPKRFALLAYLAIGRGGYHRRDTLAAMFWPELDQFAARRALRNTLYHLREALGEGVVVTRGDEAVAIDPARLTCDVNRLRDAAAASRHEDVVDGYTGELLAGVHVPNAGEAFEDWLTQERLHIADLVMGAVGALVEREENAGHPLAAARWAQRACALAPGDESWLRRAMALLDQGGDTGGALRLYEAGARRLAADFEATPSAETEALAARIRDGGRKPSGRAEAPPAELPEPATTPAPATTAAQAAPSPAPARHPRQAVRWAAGLTVLALSALLVRAALAGRAHGAHARTRVLVAVFDNRTGDAALQPLGRMAQDWLTQGLMRTRLVDVVDPQAVFVQGRDASGATVDPMTLAHRTGAAMMVSGNYYRTGDTLFLQAAVTDARAGRLVRVVGPVVSSVHTPVAGLDELRSRVMTALALAVDAHGAESVNGGDVPPFDAYRDYVDGWDVWWHGDSPHAKALFLRAARRDTAFIEAAIALVTVGANANDCGLVDSIAHALEARAQPLDRFDRLALQIEGARCRGRNEEMSRLTLERADFEPGNSAAQMPAAAAANWANRPKRALEMLARVNPATDLGWSTDTTHSAYWSGVTGALHLLGRYREELAAADHVPLAAPLTRVWFRGNALAALARPTAVLALIDSSLALPAETASDIGLAPYTEGRPEYTVTPGWVANWLARELLFHGDTVAARQAAMRAVVWYRGRSAEERATIEERLTAAWSLEVLGAYPEAEDIARGLVAEDSTNVDFRGELAGLAAQRGDTALADSLDRWLAAQPVSRVSWTASIYRARVAALLGRSDDAVARVRESFDEGLWPTWIHQEPALVPLRARRDFAALVAPKD
ncbi:MAG TPA: BTAD domain-containing putative transcriptional regulator [Gemmatimonadales bacterium]|nr:BTAD domain-containing putative transcriptional regulator [Gemmatimonadales bacterium]